MQLSPPAPPTFAVFAPRISLASAAHVPTMLLGMTAKQSTSLKMLSWPTVMRLKPSLPEVPHAVSRPATEMASKGASRGCSGCR